MECKPILLIWLEVLGLIDIPVLSVLVQDILLCNPLNRMSTNLFWCRMLCCISHWTESNFEHGTKNVRWSEVVLSCLHANCKQQPRCWKLILVCHIFFTSVIFRQFSMLRVFPNIVLIIHFISSRWGTHASKAAQRTAKTARSAIAFPPKLWSTFGWLWSPCANGVWAMQCRGWGWITKTQIPSMNVVEVYGLGYPSGPWSPDRWCTALLLCKEICPMALATPFC